MSTRSDELDAMTGQDAVISLQREFPGWMVLQEGQGVWLGSCHARRHSDGRRVSGEDWADLRDQLIGQRWKDSHDDR
jgi:hypothetical protein